MNKQLCLIATIIATFCISVVRSQESQEENVRLTTNIIYAPSQHFNGLKPGLRFGYQIPNDKNIDLIIWGGFYHSNLYIFKSALNESFFNYRDLVGFHLAIEPRKYIVSRHPSFDPDKFVSLTLGFDNIVENRREQVIRQSGAYLQSIDFKRNEISFPIIAHWGRKLFNVRSVQIDGSIGMGCRYFLVDNDLPEDAEFQEFGFFRNSGDIIDGNFFRFAFQLGLYLSIPTRG